MRSDPEKVRAWQNRSRRNLPRAGRLRQRSPRKKDRYDAIAAASREALERDGHRCQAVDLLPAICCAGRLEAHHVAPRSTAPDLVAEPSNIVGLCSQHHAYVTDHPAAARAVGLHGHAGDDLAAMALLRRQSAPDRRLSVSERFRGGFGRDGTG